MVTSIDLPSRSYVIDPALWIQSHKPRGYWPVKVFGYHRLQVTCVFVACEELWAAIGATDGCENVISGAGDHDVIAADALRVITAALCCNFR